MSENPIYWGKETINEAEYKLPFIDKVSFRIIKDQSTQVTALRTGKLDILEIINWENVETLKKSVAGAEMVARHRQPASCWRCAWIPSRSTTSACARL